jgi:hypothetical protein
MCVRVRACTYVLAVMCFFFIFFRFLASFQSRSLDHNISKRSRSPTLSHQDADGAEAHQDAGVNARRYLRCSFLHMVVKIFLGIFGAQYASFLSIVLTPTNICSSIGFYVPKHLFSI